MRIPATTLAILLLSLPCAGQQSQQNSDQGQNANPPQNQSQNQTSQDKSPAKRRSTAEDNPFPEDISKKAADAADDPAPDAPAAKSSSAPDKPPAAPANSKSEPNSKPGPAAPGDSSSRTGLHGLDDVDTAESRISDGAGGYVYNPKLAAQDMKVGGFYFDTGDYKGAYARYKEATRVDPGNADAVFGLAEAARALKLNSEAADNYRIYLDAVPNGSKAKAARKALAALGEPPKK
jgi:tetratricopeptide (TPR) repeat protein